MQRQPSLLSESLHGQTGPTFFSSLSRLFACVGNFKTGGING